MPSGQLWSVILSVAFAIVLTVTPIPETWRPVVVTAAWTFFVASLIGWLLSQKKSLSPVEKREKLDGLVRRGEVLAEKWMSGKQPTIRTWLWLSQVDAFVKTNFSLTLYDQFRSYTADAGSVFASALKKENTGKPGQKEYNQAVLIMGRYQGLDKRLRPSIRD
jgi:hypothetical protein